MTESKKFLARYLPLSLYPALKEEATDRITFYWPNTAKDQRHVRKMVKRRNYHFGIVKATKTIVFDVRYMQKATKNFRWIKTFSNAEMHFCEPIVFPMMKKWFHMMKGKSINTLDISFIISDKNKNVYKFLKPVDQLLKVKNLNISLELAAGVDYSENLKNFMKVFQKYFEWNVYRYKNLSISLSGNAVYYFGNLSAYSRHWNPKIKWILTPDEMRENIPCPPSPKREVSLLHLYFYNLKNNYSPKSLERFIENIKIFNRVQTLRLVMNKFELTPERMNTLDTFFHGIEKVDSIQAIIYYLKFYKMNFQGFLNFVSQRKELKNFAFGFLPLTDKTPGILSDAISKLSNLESLSLYVDVMSLMEQKDLTFWNFLASTQSLTKLELILSCKTSTVFDDAEPEGPKKYLDSVLGIISNHGSLQDLSIMIPELEIDLSESFNNLVMKLPELNKIQLDCVMYNINYLHELKEISKLRNIKVKIELPSSLFYEKPDEVKKLNSEEFEMALFKDPYTHFSDIHIKYYKRYVL